MIIRNVVVEEAQIKLFLRTLCNDNPLACQKESISGFTNYDRVVLVRGDTFEYHNKPIKFQDGDLNALNEKTFKAKVSLDDIYEISFLPENSEEKKGLKLSMPLNKITATNIKLYESKASSTISSKDKKQNAIISWLFNFTYDVKAKIFNSIDQQERKKKEEENKILKFDPQSDLEDSILNVSQTQNKFGSLELDPAEELDRNIEKLREIREEIEFKQKMEKQEQERMRSIKLSMKIRKKEKEETKFQNQDEEEEEEIYPIRTAWNEFWKIYEKAQETIGLAPTSQTLTKQLALLNEIYKLQVQIKTIAMDYINFKLVGWLPQKLTFTDFEYYRGIWIRLGGKQLNQQFLSNYYLSDLMYLLKPNKKLKFRIHPMFFINYKSIKAICMIDQPFHFVKALQKQIYYPKATVSSKMDMDMANKIRDGFTLYERILNIKCEPVFVGQSQINAPLGHQVRVFQYDNKFHQNSTNFIDNFYYLVGVKGLFPIDYSYQFPKYQPEYCLRPEIIAQYRDYKESTYNQQNQLLTQAFMHSDIGLDIKAREDLKVAQVSQDFIPLKIKKLMHQFNQINLIMVDSYSIKCYMSQMGINSRYLGQLYKSTQIPYIQQTLQIQMLSKTIKHIYKDTIHSLLDNQQFFKRQMYLKKHKQILEHNIKQHHQLMVQNAIDFLNLVFGVGVETQHFWAIVLDKCQKKYGHRFGFPVKVKFGGLLHAVLWHCGFVVSFDCNVKLFQVQRPFDITNWIDFRLQCKSFQYPSLEINKMVRKMSHIDYVKEGQDIKNVFFNFLKLQLLRNNHISGLNFKTQITLAKINNMHRGLQKPIRQCNYHPAQLPYYFANKSPQNFKKAIDIINFSLAFNHPLFISLYDEYSQIFQPELLKKSTLLAAIKGLGQFHPRTSELYSKYYRQGLSEFQIKAKRSSDTEAALTISEQLFGKKKYESCLNFIQNRILRRHKDKESTPSNNLEMEVQILKYGLQSAINTRFYKKGHFIAQQFSQLINTYKIKTLTHHQTLLHNALIIQMSLSPQKFYIYKMVLLACKIQSDFQPSLSKDSQMFLHARPAEQRMQILNGIIKEYYIFETHLKWIQNIFTSLRRGYIYFNYLSDLFNNYQFHIGNYGMTDFQAALGYLDVLIRFFGQRIFYENLYQVTY